MRKIRKPTIGVTKTSTNSVNREVADTPTAFPISVLPPVMRKYVQELSSSIGCDPSYVFLPLLASLARAVGNKRVVQLSEDWTEPAVIWAAVIGGSGVRKSPPFRQATSFIQQKHSEERNRYRQQHDRYERKLAVWKKSKSKSLPPREPVGEHFIASNTTFPAVVDLLNRQRDTSLLVKFDELAGLLNSFGEYRGRRELDTAQWLSFFAADSLEWKRVRGGMKEIHIDRANVSIVGGIPPTVFKESIGPRNLQNGLCARFLLTLPERRLRWWTAKAIVKSRTKRAMATVFDQLLSLKTRDAKKAKHLTPVPIHLSSLAVKEWEAFVNRRRNEETKLENALAAAWSKLEAYAARFALIFQLVSWASGEQHNNGKQFKKGRIEIRSLRRAIQLSDWFANEATRIYGLLAEGKEDQQQRELIELIRRLDPSNTPSITPSELSHATRRFHSSEEAEVALDRLRDLGLGVWRVGKSGKKGGRPSRRFWLKSMVARATG